jgi:hypothetical protein
MGPSTSASVIMKVLLYLMLFTLKSSPTPAPRAWIIVRISWLSRALSMRAFSTFSIFPKGEYGLEVAVPPCLAEPPADLPQR